MTTKNERITELEEAVANLSTMYKQMWQLYNPRFDAAEQRLENLETIANDVLVSREDEIAQHIDVGQVVNDDTLDNGDEVVEVTDEEVKELTIISDIKNMIISLEVNASEVCSRQKVLKSLKEIVTREYKHKEIVPMPRFQEIDDEL